MKKIESKKLKYMHIIDETDLISYSKIFIAPAVQSVVLIESRNTIGVALRDAAGQFFMIREMQAEWSREENEKIREDMRSFYDYIVADDRRVVVRLLAYGHTVNEFTGKDIQLSTLMYMCVDDETEATAGAGTGVSADASPGASADAGTGVSEDASRQEERDWLAYIQEHCAPEDCYGIYGAYESAYWWWEEGPRVLHIMGSAAVNLPEDKAEYYEEYADSSRKVYLDQENSHPACIVLCCGWDASLSKLVIHEGIRIFSYVPLMRSGWNLCFDEVVLPSTLREMPVMKCYADHVTIPESVSEIDLQEQWVECGGHFDPVTYPFRSMRLPSTIEIDVDMDDEDYHGQLPLLEPISYWEEIVLYGDEPIRDLAGWYKSNVFLCDIDILYPAAWDEGAEVSFRDRVVSYVRSQKPMYGERSGMDSEWFDWGEEEYRALRERVRPY